MAKKQKKKLDPKSQAWIDARTQFHLSHAQIQMARELGMNPKRFGKLANHKHEPWKSPLPVYIEELYFKHFGKKQPGSVRSIEQLAKDKKKKQQERKKRKLAEQPPVPDEGTIEETDK